MIIKVFPPIIQSNILNPGDELIYPLSQHIGAPAKAIVAKGDHVLVGQIIANGNGMISANVASSVSGTVKTIDLRLAPTGFFVDWYRYY